MKDGKMVQWLNVLAAKPEDLNLIPWRGSEKLPEEFKRILGIEAGETTPDGKFFPDCLWCVGAYGLPPVIMIESL